MESILNLLKLIGFPFIKSKSEIKQGISACEIKNEMSFDYNSSNQLHRIENRIEFASRIESLIGILMLLKLSLFSSEMNCNCLKLNEKD
jgi:hypothetical protein